MLFMQMLSANPYFVKTRPMMAKQEITKEFTMHTCFRRPRWRHFFLSGAFSGGPPTRRLKAAR